METSQQNIQFGVLFEYIRRPPWEVSRSCLEQLFWREPVSTCFCRKGLHSICYLRNFPELKHARQEAVIWRLAVYYKETSLQSFSWTFSDFFKSSLKSFVRCSFLVVLQPVGRKPATPFKWEFLEISRRATFRNITIYVIEFSAEL